MYNLDGKWQLSMRKVGISPKMGGGRMILLRAENKTQDDLLPLSFTGKVKSDGIITGRMKCSFGVLLPGETEELYIVKAIGEGNKFNANTHHISLYFDQVAIEFTVTMGGAQFVGEIPNRTDMFTKSIIDMEEDD